MRKLYLHMHALLSFIIIAYCKIYDQMLLIWILKFILSKFKVSSEPKRVFDPDLYKIISTLIFPCFEIIFDLNP